MAKLTDLPDELINRIIHHIYYQTAEPFNFRSTIPEHHLLDHNQINCSAQPKQRPHLERVIYRGFNPRTTYRGQVSWPEGLPDNPLLPLSLVNRTFRRCAQELLFKNVALDCPWTASFFLQALTCIPPPEAKLGQKYQVHDNQIKQGDSKPLNPLSQHVRSLQIAWSGFCSMEKGGGSVFCEILQSCPRLENIAISTVFRLACKEPILKALASKPFIKEFVVLHKHRGEHSSFQWLPREFPSRLFPHWPSLETVEFEHLSDSTVISLKPAPNSAIPILNCAIRTLILKEHRLDELQLSNLLKSCGESMQTLKITGPSRKLTQEAFCRVLQGSTSPNLECLKLRSICWNEETYTHHFAPRTSHLLLDMVFDSPTALKNLKTLSFEDRLATGKLFERLPKSIIKLAWNRCPLPASTLLKALLSSSDNERSLPNLKCCSVASRYGWKHEQEMAIQKALEMRGGCFHSLRAPAYGSPALSATPMHAMDDDDSDEDDFDLARDDFW